MPLPRKTALTIGTFAIMTLAPDFVPALSNYRSLEFRNIATLWEFRPRPTAPNPVEAEQAQLKPNHDGEPAEAHPVLEAETRLDRFYEALFRTETLKGNNVTRVVHYGDSPTTADMITSDVRVLLQRHFGDAGHGFVLIGKPWAWYGHQGIEVSSSNWSVDVPLHGGGLKDGYFGLGGVSFRGGPGASSRLTLKQPYQRIEVAYLQEEGGGTFSVSVDGTAVGSQTTNGPALTPGFAAFALPADTSKVSIQVTSGRVRLFGAYLTKDGPGVIYSSLGLNGAYTSVLAKAFNADHWTQELRHYQPDLVVINYGTNESMYAAYVDVTLDKELREAIRRVREAVPDAAVLVMSPMDRGQRDSSGEIGTAATIPRLVALQERIAQESGAGFFNTFEAMGGSGTMGRWYLAEPRLVTADFIHPMPAGARIVGNLLYKSLLDGYEKYKKRRMQPKLAMTGSVR